MKKITILLPVHKLDGDDVIMLKNAVDSVEDFHNDVKLTIVAPKNLKTQLLDLGLSDKLELNVLENTTNQTDFVSQVNLGISNCDT
jgi:hypothetical protein